jgi:hypothetical protein
MEAGPPRWRGSVTTQCSRPVLLAARRAILLICSSRVNARQRVDPMIEFERAERCRLGCPRAGAEPADGRMVMMMKSTRATALGLVERGSVPGRVRRRVPPGINEPRQRAELPHGSRPATPLWRSGRTFTARCRAPSWQVVRGHQNNGRPRRGQPLRGMELRARQRLLKLLPVARICAGREAKTICAGTRGKVWKSPRGPDRLSGLYLAQLRVDAARRPIAPSRRARLARHESPDLTPHKRRTASRAL